MLEDIRAMLLANARDVEAAKLIFYRQFDLIIEALSDGRFEVLEDALTQASKQFALIPTKRPLDQVPVISLMGEIFVRRDGLSRQHITEQLATRGFATVCAPVAEWVHYTDYLVNKGLSLNDNKGFRKKLSARIKQFFMSKDEHRIRNLLASSGLIHQHATKIDTIIDTAKPYISPHLGGEAILTVGSAIREVASISCGVIAIGPFGCMPNRLAESILNEAMKREDKLASEPNNSQLRMTLSDVHDLPFLAIESDGSPFPQLINAKLEAFCLSAERMHVRMMAGRLKN
jgi:predicted nucleotide-binding protein (sugar kinase/HSP70/actin superfamily)